MTATGIGDVLGLDADTVDRLLLVLVAAGVLGRDGESGYAVPAELTPYLDPDAPHYLGGFVDHLVSDEANRLSTLETYLLKGKAVVDSATPGPYERFYRDETSTRNFANAMWQLSFGISQELARMAGLAGSRSLVDVGGGSGPFAVAALREEPSLRAMVFDLPAMGPHVAEMARTHRVADRLAFAAGDFFHDPLPRGDVVALGYVMSNWPDAECLDLLTRVHHACAPGGRVLVMDRLFDDDRSGPVSTAVMNLEMHAETRGRHRTADEYLELLAAAGFLDGSVRRSNGDKHLIVGRRSEKTAAPVTRARTGRRQRGMTRGSG